MLNTNVTDVFRKELVLHYHLYSGIRDSSVASSGFIKWEKLLLVWPSEDVFMHLYSMCHLVNLGFGTCTCDI